MLESTIVRRIKSVAEKRGAFVFKTHGSPQQVKGLPDLVLCYRGRFIGMEVKVPGNKPTNLQIHRMEQIRDADGMAEAVYSVVQAIALLDEIDHELELEGTNGSVCP